MFLMRAFMLPFNAMPPSYCKYLPLGRNRLQSSLPGKSAGKITTSGGTIIRSLTPRSIGRRFLRRSLAIPLLMPLNPNSKQTIESRCIMASSKDYLSFVLEQLSDLDGISYRAMMGEYILYFRDKIIGGIYDDRLLVKHPASGLPLCRQQLTNCPMREQRKCF